MRLPPGTGRPSTLTTPPGSEVVAVTVTVPPVASEVVMAYRSTERSKAG